MSMNDKNDTNNEDSMMKMNETMKVSETTNKSERHEIDVVAYDSQYLTFLNSWGSSVNNIENSQQDKIESVAPIPTNLYSTGDYTLEMSEYNYPMAIFTSSLKNHTIKVEIDVSNREILINTMTIENHSPVELVIMLKKMVTEMKKINIAFVIQQVNKDDWFNILRDQNIFTFVNENEKYGFINIKCPIDKFPEAVMKSLGFEDFHSETNYPK
jgi:hypothetical protein